MSSEDEIDDFKDHPNYKLTEKLSTFSFNSDVKKKSDEQKKERKENLPSEEKYKNYIYFPESFQKDSTHWESGGKWMIFAGGDLDKIDYAWIVLQSLVRNGTITAIKSSTSTDTKKGVTMCYTPDWKDKKSVKKAADEIRRLIDYEFLMYYKTNKSSMEGKYCHEGATEICTYMHTRKCGFYEKEKDHNRWICLSMENYEAT